MVDELLESVVVQLHKLARHCAQLSVLTHSPVSCLLLCGGDLFTDAGGDLLTDSGGGWANQHDGTVGGLLSSDSQSPVALIH